MSSLDHLLKNNQDWANGVLKAEPDFFKRHAQSQSPDYLWIGCSDSRVPANQITGLGPGEVFVHRNIANQVVRADLNCQSVLQFAVDILKVKHIIVCGHYGCGGVTAAHDQQVLGLVDEWLQHVKALKQKHEKLLGGQDGHDARVARLCELNVIEQVVNVSSTPAVQGAWARGRQLSVHGWIYELKDGLLSDLEMSISAPDELADKYKLAIS